MKVPEILQGATVDYGLEAAGIPIIFNTHRDVKTGGVMEGLSIPLTIILAPGKSPRTQAGVEVGDRIIREFFEKVFDAD